MNPERNPQPQQPFGGQQPVIEPPIQQPATNPAQPVPPVSPVQTPPQVQSPYPYQQPKQPNKLTPIIIGGVVILIGIVVGAFLLLGGGKPESSNQSNTNQSATAEQDEVVEETEQEQTAEPSVEQSQLDTQQKNSAAKLTAAITEYTANNNGKLPAASEINSAFITQYLNGTFNDPGTGSVYKIVETDPTAGEIQYKTASTCGSDNTVVAGSRRQIAVRVPLSNGTYYCASN
jgi:hypothetical protein